MSIVSSEIIRQSGQEVEFKFTDHLANDYYETWTLKEGVDAATFMASRIPAIELNLARNEAVNAWQLVESEQDPISALPAQHQTKAEWYRRVIAVGMQEANIINFARGRTGLWVPFEADPDSGNNKPQRAAYLGVSQVEYDQADKRFGDAAAILVFVNDEKGAVWQSPPDGWF